MALPQETLECAERLLDYHRLSRIEPNVALAENPPLLPPRIFSSAPKTPLSDRLLDAPVPVLSLLMNGLDAVPESMHRPKQDLRTLSTWLYLAAGLRGKSGAAVRSFSSCDRTHAVEFYVAAFAIESVEPGLYHYSATEHALRHLRDGVTTLSLLRRGRPDLNFLATSPGAILVSGLFCRSSHVHGRRAFRHAIIDAGAATANLHAAAQGIGISTMTRMRLSDPCTRELLGLNNKPAYEDFEAVQSMVVWGDLATNPIDLSGSVGNVAPIARPSSLPTPSYGSVVAAHQDSVMRGIGVREIRPPLTELVPTPATLKFAEMPPDVEIECRSLRSVLLEPGRSAFVGKSISRSALHAISRAGFRGGTFAPLRPDGVHMAIVRPLWLVFKVIGQDTGIWWHDPRHDRWACLNQGAYQIEAGLCTRHRDELHDTAAVCVMVANVTKLLGEGGPDLYRLAHLEAGIAAQRMKLAADSLGIACVSYGDFVDAMWKQFFGLSSTGWEPLLVTAFGGATVAKPEATPRENTSLDFRD